ncbi:GAF and ANTAR domain-containing protein [Streptomyces venezuelae]|uniref:GAF and ANTAR domain-containing protein n=1 Tax=Streptomyces venezuelae TaxID=54571 RepID=UPI0016871800|nr:GAF and ANTAR domain-containing protein [Streptomyces venezuelae]
MLESLRPAPGGWDLVGADAEGCARVLGVDGVAVSVTPGSGLTELLWATPGASRQLEDLQFTLGQGPGPEAASSGAPVLVPDLSAESPDRWPALLPELVAVGIGAVFCLPLRLGKASLGALTLQRARAGPLGKSPLADAWTVTHALTAALVEDGEAWQAFAEAEETSHFYRAAVHQASGMISVQAGVSLAEALMRLRAYAYQQGRPLLEVADDVVARRVRFRHDDGDEPGFVAGGGTEGS